MTSFIIVMTISRGGNAVVEMKKERLEGNSTAVLSKEILPTDFHSLISFSSLLSSFFSHCSTKDYSINLVADCLVKVRLKVLASLSLIY